MSHLQVHVPPEALKTIVKQEKEREKEREGKNEERKERKEREKREKRARPLVRNPNWKHVPTVRGQLDCK